MSAMRFFSKPVPLWSHFAVFGVVVLVVGALAGGYLAGIFTPPWLVAALGSQSVIKNEQVVTSMEKKEQTVLLELGVKGVSEAEGIPPAVLKDFPLLKKARYMIYSGKVKLGVDSVLVKATGDHTFTVSVPEFIWISDDVNVDRVISSDGLLSAFTAQKSEIEQINNLVSSADRADYLEQNRQTLRDQAEFVFTKYAKSIDPEATLKFVYADGEAE